MSRSVCALVALLLSFTAYAVPVPQPFVSGWGNPVDPHRDCKIRRDNGALTIEMPGGDHDYEPHRERMNAPRLLRDMEGDFEVQVRLRIDSRPSAHSTVKGQSPFVSAGFLLIAPNNYSPNPYAPIYTRFEYGVSQEGSGADGYAALKTQDRKGREETDIWVGAGGHTSVKTMRPTGHRMKEFWDRVDWEWPLPKKADHVYLRLEHREGEFCFYISADGEKWTKPAVHSGPPAKLKLGLAGYSTSTETSKIIFDRIWLTRGKKKRQ